MGRPIEDLSSLPEGWENEIKRLYEEGGSDVEVKALIHGWRGSFSNDLWDRWLKDYVIFSETIKNGRLLSEAWWVRNGRINLKDKDFSYTGWYMQMKNRFFWTDRVDNTTKGNEIQPTKVVFKKFDDAE